MWSKERKTERVGPKPYLPKMFLLCSVLVGVCIKFQISLSILPSDIKLEKYKTLSEHSGDHGNYYNMDKPLVVNGHTPTAQPLSNGTAHKPQNHTPSPQPSVRLEEVRVHGQEDQDNVALDCEGVGKNNLDEQAALGESYFEVHITSS